MSRFGPGHPGLPFNGIEIRRSIEANSSMFRQLVALAEDLLRLGRHEAAARCGQVAAGFAWSNHPGVFTSPQLEDVLLAIGRQALRVAHSSERRIRTRTGNPGHVLHILTQAYALGGHTRLVWRWIQQDTGRAHSVSLTAQGKEKIPPQLEAAARATGGALHVLDTKVSGLLPRAAALRDIITSCDQVVLHIHPHDVIPIIALADTYATPPVILLNHAAHVFWLGVGVSDVVACCRTSALRLSQSRRGIEAARCGLLPIPLPPVQRDFTREVAKQRLGLSDNAVILLSIASRYKYAPTGFVSFLEAIEPVLERHERSLLLVVGPGSHDQWQNRYDRTQSRVLALGEREDLALLHQAADIYVDSFPFTSITALLEAGSYGVPVVSYCAHPDAAAVLCADDPGLVYGLVRANRIEDFRAALSRLVEDPALRSSTGGQARHEISGLHHGVEWNSILQDLYVHAAADPRLPSATGYDDEKIVDALDIALAALQRASGTAHGLDPDAQTHLLPLLQDLPIWNRLWALTKAPSFTPILLSTGWLGKRIQNRFSRLKRRLQWR